MGHIMSRAAAEMQEKQTNAMIKNQESMRRNMLVQQMAVGRERFYWFATGYSFILAGVTVGTLKTGFKPSYAIPVLFGGLFLAYQWDMVYGTKTERIYRHMQKILKEEHWFVPVNPTDKEVEELKRR